MLQLCLSSHNDLHAPIGTGKEHHPARRRSTHNGQTTSSLLRDCRMDHRTAELSQYKGSAKLNWYLEKMYYLRYHGHCGSKPPQWQGSYVDAIDEDVST